MLPCTYSVSRFVVQSVGKGTSSVASSLPLFHTVPSAACSQTHFHCVGPFMSHIIGRYIVLMYHLYYYHTIHQSNGSSCLCACQFDLLLSFPNIWTLSSLHRLYCLSCVTLTAHKYALKPCPCVSASVARPGVCCVTSGVRDHAIPVGRTDTLSCFIGPVKSHQMDWELIKYIDWCRWSSPVILTGRWANAGAIRHICWTHKNMKIGLTN